MTRFKLGARAYIYPLIALGICFFFYVHSRRAASEFKTESRPHRSLAVMPADAELGEAGDIDKPSLYLFGNSAEDVFAEELRTELKGVCTVMHIRSSGQDVKKHFGITELPCAILFDCDMTEMHRFPPKTVKHEIIEKVRKCLSVKSGSGE